MRCACWVLAASLLVAAAVAWSSVGYQWFGQLGFASMFRFNYGTRAAIFGVTGGFVALVAGFSAGLARWLRPPTATAARPIRHERLLLGLLLGAAGVTAGLVGARSWLVWVQFANRTSFGRRDPQFHLDLSFYVFVYPFLRLVLGYLFAAVLLALVVAVVVHGLYGGLRLRPGDLRVSAGARAQLCALLGVFMLLKAAAYWLDRYGIEFSSRDLISDGASYTDVHAVLPAKTVLAVIAVLCAVLFFAAAGRHDPLLPTVGFGLLVLSAILIGGVYPAAVQQFSVRPHELTRETSYLDQELDGTRRAFGLSQVQASPYLAASGQDQQLGPVLSSQPDFSPGTLARVTTNRAVMPARFRATARYWPGKDSYLGSPVERVAQLAPFLTLDGNAYPVVVRGQLDWVVDGYTTTSRYPDSASYDLASVATGQIAPQGPGRGQIDYIRDAVKAVVSATSGRVTLYQWDTADPILRAYVKAFPGLIRPRAALPAALRAQLRYPADLFGLQSQVLARYHVTTAAAFYRDRAWTVTRGAHAAHSADYTRDGGTALAAALTVGHGPAGPGYGRLRLLEVPAGIDLASPQQSQRAAALADLASAGWSRP